MPLAGADQRVQFWAFCRIGSAGLRPVPARGVATDGQDRRSKLDVGHELGILVQGSGFRRCGLRPGRPSLAPLSSAGLAGTAAVAGPDGRCDRLVRREFARTGAELEPRREDAQRPRAGPPGPTPGAPSLSISGCCCSCSALAVAIGHWVAARRRGADVPHRHGHPNEKRGSPSRAELRGRRFAITASSTPALIPRFF